MLLAYNAIIDNDYAGKKGMVYNVHVYSQCVYSFTNVPSNRFDDF